VKTFKFKRAIAACCCIVLSCAGATLPGCGVSSKKAPRGGARISRAARQALKGCEKAARGCASFRSVAQGGARWGGCSMLHKAAEGCKRPHEAAQARAGQRKALLDGRSRSSQPASQPAS